MLAKGADERELGERTAQAPLARDRTLMTFGSSLTALVHTIANRLIASGTMTYAHFGLGFLEARLLYVLRVAQPTMARRLAERLSLDPSAISRAIVRLTDRGLVAKSPKSKRLLVLTDEGQQMADAIRSVFEERSLRLIDGVPAEELQVAQAVLERMQANLTIVADLAEAVRFPPQTAP